MNDVDLREGLHLHVAVLTLPLVGVDRLRCTVATKGGLISMREPAMTVVTTIGIDIAKFIFQAHGIDAAGCAVLRRRLRRQELLAFFERLPPCLIGMEACSSAHHWARELVELGHEVRLIPPQYAKPYVKRNKTDAADAEAICEAVGRPNMRFVPIKDKESQGLLALH